MQVEPIGTPAAVRRLVSAIDAHRATPLALSPTRRDIGPYRGYAEMLMALRELVRRGAVLDVIGESVEGEPLFALSVGNQEANRTTALLSGVHPTEWIGIETHLTLLDDLVDKPPDDRRVVSVVIVNPDGVRRVEGNLRGRRRRFVRHNHNRVDLNRNFPSYWGRLSLAGLLPGKLFSGGQGPASEPEVRSVTAFFKGSMIDRAVSFHSSGGMVFFPYGAMLRAPIDAAEHRRWARYVARQADPARPYRAVQSSHWVPGVTAPGMELDWFHDQHGALSLLIECSRGGVLDGWRRVDKLLEPFAWFNPPRPDTCAPRIARAVEPFVRGMVRPPGE